MLEKAPNALQILLAGIWMVKMIKIWLKMILIKSDGDGN